MEAKVLFTRYTWFCTVGGCGMLLDMAVLWLLVSPAILGWNMSLSKVGAADLSLGNNFVWNELWTFRGLTTGRRGWRERLGRFLKFNLICTAGIGLSVVLLNAQVHGLGWNMYVANFIAIVLVSIWNFALNLKFCWTGGGTNGVLLSVAWLASMFAAYRAGVWWIGAPKACGCLGSLGDLLPVSEGVVNHAMLVILVYLWVGSVGLLLLSGLDRRNLAARSTIWQKTSGGRVGEIL